MITCFEFKFNRNCYKIQIAERLANEQEKNKLFQLEQKVLEGTKNAGKE